MKFACVKGGKRAKGISLTSISQEAFDLAKAHLPADQACFLFILHMPDKKDCPGGILQLPEAKRLCETLISGIAEHEIAALARRDKAVARTPEESTINKRHFRLGGTLFSLAREYEKARFRWLKACDDYARSFGAKKCLVGKPPSQCVVGLVGCEGVPAGWRKRGKNQGGYRLKSGEAVIVPDLRSEAGPAIRTKLNSLVQPTVTTLLHMAGVPRFIMLAGRPVWTTVTKLAGQYILSMGASEETAGFRGSENLTEIRQQEWARSVEAQAKGGQPGRTRKGARITA